MAKKPTKRATKRPKKIHKDGSVHLKPHHAKPYRKRHLGLLSVSLLASVLLSILLVDYNARISTGVKSARNFVSELFSDNTSNQTVKSTNGFSFEYSPKEFYATAIDGSSGNLFLGEELSTIRAYQTVRISPNWVESKDNQVNLTIDYLANQSAAKPDELATRGELKTAKLIKGESTQVKLGGVDFAKTSWTRQPQKSLSNLFDSTFVTYIGTVNGDTVLIKVNNGFGGPTSAGQFDEILNSLSFSSKVTKTPAPNAGVQAQASMDLIDSLLFSKLASAATKSVNAAEKVSALYSPAVVKVIHIYCYDISANDETYLTNVCDGGIGSGFFVGQDGFVATNGHVAVASAKDIAIYNAIVQLVYGDAAQFNFLAELSGLTDADLAGAKDEDEVFAIAIDAFYEMDDSILKTTNGVTNLLVSLNEKQPDIKEIVDTTKNHQEFPEQDSLKRAELIAWDYRKIDGIKGFKASDVAILKVEGNNFPVTKLGSLSGVSQGGNLNILGFPGNAGDNQLVESTQSKATLTTGKISSVKNAAGSEKKLIETDTTIGHGNSGGPAFDDNGNVIGIATYTIDGSGEGNGVYNYVRDIKDLQDIAAQKTISFDVKSATQEEWDKGINKFYESRYSSSIKNFNKVKELFPQHATANEFIASAEQRIKNGEDVKDFPIVLVVIGLVVVVGGAAFSIITISRHHSKHQLYKVATGQMNNPVVAGQPPQPPQPPLPPQPPVAPQPISPPTPTVPQPPSPTPPPPPPEATPGEGQVIRPQNQQ